MGYRRQRCAADREFLVARIKNRIIAPRSFTVSADWESPPVGQNRYQVLNQYNRIDISVDRAGLIGVDNSPCLEMQFEISLDNGSTWPNWQPATYTSGDGQIYSLYNSFIVPDGVLVHPRTGLPVTESFFAIQLPTVTNRRIRIRYKVLRDCILGFSIGVE